jgi:hypothetical protein
MGAYVRKRGAGRNRTTTKEQKAPIDAVEVSQLGGIKGSHHDSLVM